MSDLTFGIKLTADGKQLVGEVRASREEFDKLGTSAQRAAQQTKSYWAEQQQAANASAASWLKGNAAADAAADKAWALANGYKEVGGQVLKSGAESAKGMGDLGLNTQYARRELMQLGKEAVTGDFSRMPKTFASLATHSNLLPALLTPIGAGIAAVTVAAVAGGYAWYKWGESAKEALDKAKSAAKDASADLKAAMAGVTPTDQESINTLQAKIDGAKGQLDAALVKRSGITRQTDAMEAQAIGATVISRRAILVALERQVDQLQASIYEKNQKELKKANRSGEQKLKKEDDPFKLENEAWVREKEFQIAQLEEARKKLQKQVEDSAKGGAILGRLGGDFDAEISKKNRALNDATMSAADKQHADNLDTVAQRAAKAREELAKLGITEEARAQLLVSVDQVEAEQIRRMEELRQQVEKNNASWEYGANVALRNYRDEAANVAKQSESLFTKAFKGAEDAVTKFAMTGKLSIRDFAQTVIEEFMRINVSRPMVSAGAGMLGDLFGAMLGSGGGGGGSMAAPGSANDVLVMMGAGRASGGAVYPNTLHPVNERGPELLNYGGSDYLMMGGRGGYVKPLTSAGGGAPSSSGGTVIHLTNAPVINIDSRSDQAQVRQLVQSAVQQGNAQLVDKLHRQGAL